MSTFQILFFFVFNALEVFFDFFFCIVFFFRVIAPIWSLRNFASLLCPLSSHLFSFHSKKKRFACKVLSDFLERESVHCADKKSMKRKRLMMEQNSTFIDARPCLKKKKTEKVFAFGENIPEIMWRCFTFGYSPSPPSDCDVFFLSF